MSDDILILDEKDAAEWLRQPQFALQEDSAGLLGPNNIVDSVGSELQVYHHASDHRFVNPFKGRADLNEKRLKNVAETVFWCKLIHDDGNADCFSMFSLKLESVSPAFTVFATAARKFTSAKSSGEQFYRFQCGYGTNCEKLDVQHVPFEYVILRNGIAFIALNATGAAMQCGLIYRFEKEYNIRDEIAMLGFSRPVDVEKVFKRPDGYFGWNDECKLCKEEFLPLYARAFGDSKKLVLSSGTIEKDKEHGFANINSGMVGGPVFLVLSGGDCPLVIGVNLGLDTTCNLIQFALFNTL